MTFREFQEGIQCYYKELFIVSTGFYTTTTLILWVWAVLCLHLYTLALPDTHSTLTEALLLRGTATDTADIEDMEIKNPDYTSHDVKHGWHIPQSNYQGSKLTFMSNSQCG